MSFFDLDPVADQNLLNEGRRTGVRPQDIRADFFEGAGTGLLNGLKTSYNRDLFNIADKDNQELRDRAINRIEELKPNPTTVGAAGQFLHGMGDQLGTLYLNFAGGNYTPQLMAAASSESYAKSQKEIHIREGMDPATAESVAKTEGIGLGLGAVVPGGMAGGLFTRSASGAAVNLAMGVGQRAVIQHTLNNAGYGDMARQYAPFEGSSVATDVMIGALFGGLLGPRAAGKEPGRPHVAPSDLDVGLTQNNAAHVELGTAPGIPTDLASRASHVEAMDSALASLIKGENVNVGDQVSQGQFIENPSAVETRSQIVRVVEDHMGPEWKSFEQELSQRGLPTDTTLYSINGPREPLPPVPRASFEGVHEVASVETIAGAEKAGKISSEEATLAKWLLEQNPAIGKDLGVLFREGAGDQVGGEYNPLRRLATIFTGGGDPMTTVHEFLHHTERMMPDEVRSAIQREWMDQVNRLDRVAAETGNTEIARALADVRKSNMGDDAAHQRVVDMVKQGLVGPEFYALVNPSEFWAVNASKLVRERAKEGWVQKAVQWVKELIEKAKDAFGMRSDASVIRGLDAVLKSDGTLSGDVLAVGAPLKNVEAPGKGVAQENLNGFEPGLRVTVPMGKVKLPAKPLVLTGTNKKNAARQIANIDEVLAKFPNADTSPLEWSRMMAYAMATDDVPVPPYRFLKDINSDGAYRSLSRLSAGQIADAKHGFENAQAFRDAYINKELDVETTGKLFMWSFLSRGVSPYTQEGLFIDGFKGAGEWIKKAADGNLTEADFPAYEAWAKSVAPQGSGQPGSGATHNLNAFGKLFLFKMGQRDESGVSLLQKMHTMMEDPNVTGQQIRRWFIENTEGVGIDNKVVSFTLLVAGFKDLMVLDRVQIRQLWDDGRFGDRNLYDGRKVDGKPVAGSALSEITYGARGLLIYEAIERALAKRIENLYTALGRPEDGSVGRYHWETWVADSQQEASHGTLDAILHDAKGNHEMISQVTAKEGEYGAYAYGARYGRDEAGQPYFMYGVNGGNEHRFTVGAFREFLDAVKLPKNGVVPGKFKVTEAGNAPWYERPEVNRQALEQLAERYAGEPGSSEGAGAVLPNGEGQAVPDRAGRTAAADPYSPEAVIANNPALTIVNEDGTMVSAGRALTGADAEIAIAKRESQGYDAAVACALRG